MMAGNKLGWDSPKLETELLVLVLDMMEVNIDRFSVTVDYENYRLLKKISLYGDDLADEPHKMAKKMVLQMIEHTFSGKDPMSIASFLLEFKLAYNACRIHGNNGICLLKEYLADPAETAVEVRVTLINITVFTMRTLRNRIPPSSSFLSEAMPWKTI